MFGTDRRCPYGVLEFQLYDLHIKNMLKFLTYVGNKLNIVHFDMPFSRCRSGRAGVWWWRALDCSRSLPALLGIARNIPWSLFLG